jgi:hypothetical protein
VENTITNVKELLSSSVGDKAEEDTQLIKNILNTVNYDLGFVQSKIIDETDIRSFTNISEFVEFLHTQKEAARKLLEVMQKAGPLRDIFNNMTNNETDSSKKTELLQHYESSFKSIVEWLSSYINTQAPYIAQLVEGSKSAQAATTSKGSGETTAGQTATTPGMPMQPGMSMEGMSMEGMQPGIQGMPMGGMPMGGMPMGGMSMGGMPMGGMPMGGMPMGGMPMQPGMMSHGYGYGIHPGMGGMQPRMSYPSSYGVAAAAGGGSKKTLKYKKGKGKGKGNKHFTIKNKKVHNKNA